MELLETARIDAFAKDDVILPVSRRNSVLFVVWEGTCVEFKSMPKSEQSSLQTIREEDSIGGFGAVWYAGDWTGPIALQPDKRLSGGSDLSETHDIVAMSSAGVKVSTPTYWILFSFLRPCSHSFSAIITRRQLVWISQVCTIFSREGLLSIANTSSAEVFSRKLWPSQLSPTKTGV